MIGVISMPHKMADPLSVVPPSWILNDRGGILGDRIEDWTPSAGLKLSAHMEILGEDFAASCGLDISDEIVVCASWRCTTTHMRGAFRIEPRRLDRCMEPIILELVVPPGALDGALVLRTSVTLHRHSTKVQDPTIATRPGSVLWYDHPTGRTVSLGSPRFPVTSIDFAASRFGEAGSSWRLLLDTSDLTASFEGTVRLLINSRNERIVAAVTEGWRDSGASVIRNLISFSVQRDLVHAALDRIAELIPVEVEAGSVGEVLKTILQDRFPDMDPKDIRKERDRDPQAFETHLQARLGLLQGGEPS